MTRLDAEDFFKESAPGVMGARVLLLSPVPPFVGARRADAAGESGVRGDPPTRGGARPPEGARLG